MEASSPYRPSRRTWVRMVGRSIRRTFLRPQMLAFLPALVLGGYWFGLQGVLMIVALTSPMLFVLGGLFERDPPPVDGLTGMLTQGALEEAADDAMFSAQSGAEAAILIAFEIDGGADLEERLGPRGIEVVLCRIADRLNSALRGTDRVARIGDYRFGVLLSPDRNAGMDISLRTAERLQGAASEGISIDAGTVYVTLSAGVCLERRAPQRTGQSILASAVIALEEAKANGQGTVRSFSSEMRQRADARQSLADDFARALEAGEVVPWFQPQICARTGAISGFEILARWQHPERGVLSPAEFLPAAEATGQMERLGETMLYNGLSALRRWDRGGLKVPKVGVNFSSAELRNPKLVEKVRWELDRFDLTPERLAIEILETVVAGAEDDAITTNISGLAKLGCTIDLDDFGVGAAPISNIRRFAVSRLKIDRSFVTRVDADPAQRKMVDALLSMAEKLDLETLAEGVETMAEHALLAEMGCTHLQGYAIARPMPPEDAETWIKQWRTRPTSAGVAASLSA